MVHRDDNLPLSGWSWLLFVVGVLTVLWLGIDLIGDSTVADNGFTRVKGVTELVFPHADGV